MWFPNNTWESQVDRLPKTTFWYFMKRNRHKDLPVLKAAEGSNAR